MFENLSERLGTVVQDIKGAGKNHRIECSGDLEGGAPILVRMPTSTIK